MLTIIPIVMHAVIPTLMDNHVNNHTYANNAIIPIVMPAVIPFPVHMDSHVTIIPIVMPAVMDTHGQPC